MIELPKTMTAAVTTAHGGPGVIEIHHDWPKPEPGPGQALVQVTAAALNNTDLWSRLGAYGTSADPDAVVGWRGVPLEFPLIQGGDIAGSVVAVGEAVDESLIGKRVLVDPILRYEQDLPTAVIGSEADGGFAQYHVSSVGRLHDVTGSLLTDEQLSCLPIAYGTAVGMVERGDCQPGERILVTGASGGVGSALLQVLAARGCHVIAQTTAGKARRVEEWGPAEIFLRDRDELEDLPEVDAVLDVVGGEQFGRVIDRLRAGGRAVIAGAIASPVVSLDLRRLYLRQRTLIGSIMHTREQFAKLAGLARTGEVHPLVAETYPLSELAAAQARFEDKDFIGKLVITISRAERA